MAAGDISAIIDSLEYNAGGSYYTALLKVNNSIYLVADAVGASQDATIYSFAVDSFGNIGAAPIDSLVLSAADFPSGFRHSLIHVSGDVFACAYERSDQVVVQTFTCDAAGNIGAAVIDTITLGATPANLSFKPDLKWVQSDIYVVAYTYNAGVGFTFRGQICTIRINANGQIDEPVLSTLIFQNSFGTKCNLLKVTVNHFLLIAGETTPAIQGIVRQINITDAGVLSQIANALIFDVSRYTGGTILPVSGNTYVIFYEGGAGLTFGQIRTISADFVGDPTNIATWQFYGATSDWPSAVEISKNQAGNGKIFAVILGIDGAVAPQLRTFEILNNGTITAAAIDTQVVNARYAYGPDIVHGVGEICVMSARSGAALNKGTVYSVTITAAKAAGVRFPPAFEELMRPG